MKNEKHKKALTFPCEFPLKVMGLANDEFEVAALHVIHKHYPDLAETAIRMRHSKNKSYLSLTVTVSAQSQEQLDALYEDLSASKHIIMVL